MKSAIAPANARPPPDDSLFVCCLSSVFIGKPPPKSEAIPFDMVDVESSHHGDRCTFETLVHRFAIEDKAARLIAELIHDADLEDEKFQRTQCIGIDPVLKGWGKGGMTSEEIMVHGFKSLDGLYEFLQRR